MGHSSLNCEMQILNANMHLTHIQKHQHYTFVFCSLSTRNIKWIFFLQFSSVQFSSVTQSCLTLCDPMNRSTPGLPVHHKLPEFTQTQVHQISDAIQPSHPLVSPSPPALNPSQHQSLFQWVSSSHEVDKVLEFQLQHHSLQGNPRADLLQNGLVGSPCSPRDSQESSPTPQFKSINSSALSLLHNVPKLPFKEMRNCTYCFQFSLTFSCQMP